MMMATPPLSPTRHQFAKEQAEDEEDDEEEEEPAGGELSSEPICLGERKGKSRTRAGSAPPVSRAPRPARATPAATVAGNPVKIPAIAPGTSGQPPSAWNALLPGVAPIRANSRPAGRSSARPSLSTEQLHQQVPIVLAPEREARLTMEMYSLFESLLPTEESHQRRQKLISKIEHIIHTEWPGQDIKVLPFGSTVNDLGTNTSDVDICILTSWLGLQGVEMLAEVFRKHGMDKVFCVPGAKVPIVKLWDPELQLSCDMNINTQLGIMNSRMVRTYVAIDPRVRPFAMIIKHWARKRVLNDAANGGTISTYTWICMVINFLQMRSPPILPALHDMPHELSIDNQVINGNNTSFFSDLSQLEGFGRDNKESLGGLLYAFFRKFAIEFDYDHHVASVRHGCYLTKESKGWHIPGKHYRLLCVEEPFDTTRNLGNSCDMASSKGLKQEFRRALDILNNNYNHNHHHNHHHNRDRDRDHNYNGSLDQVCEQWMFPCNFNSNRYHPSNSANNYATMGKRYGNGFRPHHNYNSYHGGDGDAEDTPKHKEPSRQSRSSHFTNASTSRHDRGQEKRSRSSPGSHSKDPAPTSAVMRTNDTRHDSHSGSESGSMGAIPEDAAIHSKSNTTLTGSGTRSVQSSPQSRPRKASMHTSDVSTAETGNHSKQGSKTSTPSSSPRQKSPGKNRNGDGSKAHGAQKNGRVNSSHRDVHGKSPRATVELCLADIAKIVKSEVTHPESSANMDGAECKKKKGGKKSVPLWSTNSSRGDSRGGSQQAKSKPIALPSTIDEAGPLLDTTKARLQAS
ncbi:hypothetical protein BGX34_010451 [Mortierella sp. NVP85]|nr:hypothetical protein BGX34_010451 [Mortierella sp. NVP85]